MLTIGFKMRIQITPQMTEAILWNPRVTFHYPWSFWSLIGERQWLHLPLMHLSFIVGSPSFSLWISFSSSSLSSLSLSSLSFLLSLLSRERDRLLRLDDRSLDRDLFLRLDRDLERERERDLDLDRRDLFGDLELQKMDRGDYTDCYLNIIIKWWSMVKERS